MQPIMVKNGGFIRRPCFNSIESPKGNTDRAQKKIVLHNEVIFREGQHNDG